jgi:hypothetical protein
MPELQFHPDIEFEVKASYIWYQKQANGLGEDFLNELELACACPETAFFEAAR